MQNYMIMIGGLETGFMEKLALFLQQEMGDEALVSVTEKKDPVIWPEAGTQNHVLTGSRDWVNAVNDPEDPCPALILTQDPVMESGEIYQYQSGEMLCRLIREQCRSWFPEKKLSKPHTDQMWDVFTGDTAAWKLTAYSAVWAELQARQQEVLYVFLGECCFLEELYEVYAEHTMDDLILDLRQGTVRSLECYTGKLEHVAYIPPLANPMILHELTGADVEGLIRILEEQSHYDRIVFVLGNTCCECQQILQRGDAFFHITESRLVHGVIGKRWEQFVRQCRVGMVTEIRMIDAGNITIDCPGVHLLYQWAEGNAGKDLCDGRTMAGDQGLSGSRIGSDQGSVR